jgi:hypothetical protein
MENNMWPSRRAARFMRLDCRKAQSVPSGTLFKNLSISGTPSFAMVCGATPNFVWTISIDHDLI